MTGPQTNEERVTSEAVALVDRADRVKDLLEFLAGYTLLVDACEDGATVDQLNMGYLGIPLLEAREVVQELSDAVNRPMPNPDDPDGEDTVQPTAG